MRSQSILRVSFRRAKQAVCSGGFPDAVFGFDADPRFQIRIRAARYDCFHLGRMFEASTRLRMRIDFGVT